MRTSTLFLLVITQLLKDVIAQGCLQPANPTQPIPFEDLGRGGSDRLPSGSQAIVTSYQFRCCGNITQWQTHVHPSGGNHNGGYSIYFQVWRPGEGVATDGCYRMVGEDRYNDIPLTNNPRSLVSKTLGPSNMIPVQPGDVVGYYTLQRDVMDGDIIDGEEDGVQLDPDFNQESVWYFPGLDLVSSGQSCPFPVGSERTLSSSINTGPMLSVRIDSYPCTPSIPPQVVMTSSPVPAILPSPTPTPTPQLMTPDTGPPPPATPTPSQTPLALSPSSPDTGPPSPATPTPVQPLATTDMEPTGGTLMDTPTGPSTLPVGNNARVDVIVGVVVTLVLLVLVLLVVVILAVFLLRRRATMKSANLSDTVGVNNPNYEPSSVSFLKNIPKKSKGKRKKDSKPAPIALDITETAMYESLDTEPLDYTYAHPSPTNSKEDTYSYIPTKKEWENGTVEANYHVSGPTGSKAPLPPPVPTRNNTNSSINTNGGVEADRFYHVLEGAEGGDAVHYEDPTLPKFRESVKNEKDTMFDSIGSYVPTEEQRLMFPSNYEQQDKTKKMKEYNRLQFFVEDQIYWAPATTTSDLYAQLASKKYREIHRNQIRILEQLGSGQFGEVFKALWTVDGKTLQLAIKTLISGASEDDKIKFLQEAAIMGQFSHPNVIKLYGVVTVGEPVMLCSELLANGDLRSYLQSIDLRELSEMQVMFLNFAKEIAAGMNYLSQKSFVHRDLAARNVLLDDSLTCKIGDFGMARDLMDDTYYRSSGGKIPVKWTAPEALLYKKYSPDSDVWSYGMVLFEIWSVAKKPFSTITNNKVLKLIQTGFCQAPPPGCPRAVYELMVHCWNPDHDKRPSFKQICSQHLQESSFRLLYWSPDDNNLSPSVGLLGAPLEQAFKLHMDLQEKYTKPSK